MHITASNAIIFVRTGTIEKKSERRRNRIRCRSALPDSSPRRHSGPVMRFAVLEALREGRAHEPAEQNDSRLRRDRDSRLHHARDLSSFPLVSFCPPEPDERTGKIIVCVYASGIWALCCAVYALARKYIILSRNA